MNFAQKIARDNELFVGCRQIRETINYLFEEPMLHYYTSTLLKSFWPGGVLASSYPTRTQEMQEQTANAARSLLINNIPEVMCNLVGAETAKHGATKVFETVQNATYNKQLFYVSMSFISHLNARVNSIPIDLFQ